MRRTRQLDQLARLNRRILNCALLLEEIDSRRWQAISRQTEEITRNGLCTVRESLLLLRGYVRSQVVREIRDGRD
jgi:hypothetical protein